MSISPILKTKALAWLSRIAERTSGNKPADLSAWANDLALEFPTAEAFTDRSRRTYASRLTFWPAYGEICEFLREYLKNRERERGQREKIQLDTRPAVKRSNPYEARDAWVRDNAKWLDQLCEQDPEPLSLRWWLADDILDKAMRNQPLTLSEHDVAKRARWLRVNPKPGGRRGLGDVARPSYPENPGPGPAGEEQHRAAGDERFRVSVREMGVTEKASEPNADDLGT